MCVHDYNKANEGRIPTLYRVKAFIGSAGRDQSVTTASGIACTREVWHLDFGPAEQEIGTIASEIFLGPHVSSCIPTVPPSHTAKRVIAWELAENMLLDD